MEWDLKLNNVNGWSSNVRNVLISIDKADELNQRKTVDLRYARTKLIEMYNECWYDEVCKKSKLSNYKEFKK